ncbi:MAG: helix-turn-helix transcriptional regulator [Acidobacteriota bacterium]
MTTRHGGTDRVSTKAKLAVELTALGRILVSARGRAGMKQSEVAARLGLPASYLSKIEKGTRRLDVIELVLIAEAIEADPAELIRELQTTLKVRQ